MDARTVKRCGVGGVVALLALAGSVGAGVGFAASSNASNSGCGPNQTGALVEAIDDRLVHAIYDAEQSGPEEQADLARVSESRDLLLAVASDNAKAAYKATYRLVYHPVWHIVRLRVLDSAGRVLSDVGGPDILAPVTGKLVYDGATVGSFVMSVQDDRGYVKLVSGVPGLQIELYRHGAALMGSLATAPQSPPTAPTFTSAGIKYFVDSYNLEAFPSGTLKVVVLITPPDAALDSETCPRAQLSAVTDIVSAVAHDMAFSGYPFAKYTYVFVRTAYLYTQAPIFVFDGKTEVTGTNELVGVQAPPPPKKLTLEKTVKYRSQTWAVRSIAPYPPDRVYILQPATLVSGATGPSGTTGTSQTTGTSGTTGPS